jgi:FlaA1/EpsC-like NDP-sugar epimerase
MVGCSAALLGAYLARFESFVWPSPYGQTFWLFLPLALAIKFFIFYRAGLYRRLWRYAGWVELERIALTAALAGAICFLLGVWILPALGILPVRIPVSIAVLDSVLTVGVVALPRFLIRAANTRNARQNGHPKRRVLIAGAGSAGEIIAKELQRNPDLDLIPVGFVDDDPAKHNLEMCGLKVLGGTDRLVDLRERYRVDELVIAMPASSGAAIRRLVQLAQAAGLRTKTIPGMFELLSGQVSLTSLRPVQIEDLLRRDPVRIDLDRVQELVDGQSVLVTGAGGSIGTEICRQVAALGPRKLFTLGHGENSIFTITAELTDRFPSLEVVPLIADVRDADRIRQLFETHRPAIVLHAAAHKHVPLMEVNVIEAVSNNVIGTKNVADAAVACGTSRLVMVSTDKAVRPTNVMGASKRVAEQIVQEQAERHERNFISVRFGNVLGSRGSVIPIFLRQIEAGGPVTVTHPEMRRYFMTIPESVQLVLQAAALGGGGEVYVLDMGEPVKIVDLARDLIRLSGLEVGRDVEVQFTGVRPGEKLYEELFFGREHAEPTDHPKVMRARQATLPVGMTSDLWELIEGTKNGLGDDELRRLLRRLVPDYHPEDSAHNISSIKGLSADQHHQPVQRSPEQN